MKRKYFDRAALVGQSVRVYRNLRCKLSPLYSVQIYYHGVGYRLVGHTRELLLKDVAFSVSQSGRQRVIAQQSKNVHAYVEGVLISHWTHPGGLGQRVSYNPYASPFFRALDTHEPIWKADYAIINHAGLTAYR